MKHVYLVRHGQTTHNRDGLVQDGTTKLTDRGILQANRVAERLQGLDSNHLIVSDYERTKQTAQPIVELSGMEPEYTPLWREIWRPSDFFHTDRNLPPYQNFLKEESEQFAKNENWKFSDEASFAEVHQRMHDALAMTLARDGDVVVVSHGHFIRRIASMVAMGGTLTGAEWQKMGNNLLASNTGITTLVYEHDQWALLTFNDHAHFAV